jgi:hypothetical protein
MAASNFTLYSAAVNGLGLGIYNFSSDNYNCILLTTSYTPLPDSDTLYSDISANEVAAGGGYSTGGTPLAGITWVRSGATSTLSAYSVYWSGATFAARYAVIIRRAGVSLAGTDRLLAYSDLTGGGNASVTAATFQVNFNNASTPASANTVFTLVHTP